MGNFNPNDPWQNIDAANKPADVSLEAFREWHSWKSYFDAHPLAGDDESLRQQFQEQGIELTEERFNAWLNDLKSNLARQIKAGLDTGDAAFFEGLAKMIRDPERGQDRLRRAIMAIVEYDPEKGGQQRFVTWRQMLEELELKGVNNLSANADPVRQLREICKPLGIKPSGVNQNRGDKNS